MTDSSGLALALDPSDQTTILAMPGAAPITRARLRADADDLLRRLQAKGFSRALVCSDDPSLILAAVDAASRSGADLWIAHTNLPGDLRDEVIRQFGVQLVLDDDGSHERDVAGEPCPQAAGRIHLMTSGTTGRPKIAAHTLESLLSRVKAASNVAANRDGRWLLTYQPTGFAGLQVMLTAVLTGGTLVVPTRRTPAGFLEAALAFDVTQISATPTFWRSFLMVMPPGALPLRQITLGGEGVDQATLDRVRGAFPNARITHIYASTEAGVVFAVHDGREGFPAEWLDRPAQGVELRLRDGLLHIRTPNAMQRYVSETEQPLLDDGWLATADRCEVTGGRVRLLGRQDSTINVAGSKVYPLAVETFLLGVPGVAEARVMGVPNPISGFLVGADIVLAPGESVDDARVRIMAACRQGLAGYQVPRVMKFVDAIEVRESGKKG